VLVDEVEVAAWKLDLRQHDCPRAQQRDEALAPDPGERGERREPDDVLRREHLAERHERQQRRETAQHEMSRIGPPRRQRDDRGESECKRDGEQARHRVGRAAVQPV